MKIINIIGARPQFIKAALISRELRKYSKIKEICLHTGQHYDNNMSSVFFTDMNIPEPKYNLEIFGLQHGAMTGRMLEKIEEIIFDEKPDIVLVYGDTNSTLAGALAAKKQKMKLAHVESGLRSYNMEMPEEINRILTDRISDILFCPSQNAINNLKNEGYNGFNCKIVKCGDVMYDAVLYFSNYLKRPKFEISNPFVLITLHRAENTNNLKRFNNIIDTLNEISNEIDVIFPVHPRTYKILKDNKNNVNFHLVEPQGYLQMLYLIKNCSLVMTDSGGLQKEAFFMKKPCVTLRDETEWIELVDNGYNIIAGAIKEKIISAYQEMILLKKSFNDNFYGDGNAAKIIVNEIIN
jgi:UDP-GlcNAc3NAcA epimerase